MGRWKKDDDLCWLSAKDASRVTKTAAPVEAEAEPEGWKEPSPRGSFKQRMAQMEAPVVIGDDYGYEAPEPVYEQEGYGYQPRHEPYGRPEPVYGRPEPVYERPEPAYERREPVYERREPVYERPEPVYEQPKQYERRGNPRYSTYKPDPAPPAEADWLGYERQPEAEPEDVGFGYLQPPKDLPPW